VGALEYSEDFTFRPPLAVQTRDAGQHAIAMHRLLCLFRGKEDVAMYLGNGRIRNDKAVAIAMHRNFPRHVFRIFDCSYEMA
jgi:hypothetical protein